MTSRLLKRNELALDTAEILDLSNALTCVGQVAEMKQARLREREAVNALAGPQPAVCPRLDYVMTVMPAGNHMATCVRNGCTVCVVSQSRCRLACDYHNSLRHQRCVTVSALAAC